MYVYLPVKPSDQDYSEKILYAYCRDIIYVQAVCMEVLELYNGVTEPDKKYYSVFNTCIPCSPLLSFQMIQPYKSVRIFQKCDRQL